MKLQTDFTIDSTIKYYEVQSRNRVVSARREWMPAGEYPQHDSLESARAYMFHQCKNTNNLDFRIVAVKRNICLVETLEWSKEDAA